MKDIDRTLNLKNVSGFFKFQTFNWDKSLVQPFHVFGFLFILKNFYVFKSTKHVSWKGQTITE